jgi:small subunit ribosomal protein S20
MANHKSSVKRIRSNEAKKVKNRYKKVTAFNIIKGIRKSHNKDEIKIYFQPFFQN